MGLTSPDHDGAGDRDQGDPDDDIIDLVAAYAADAVGDDDRLVVETYLATSTAATSYEQTLRSSAGSYASIVLPESESPAPGHLRSRVLDAALLERPARPPAPSAAVAAHRIETERARLLFGRLAGDQWHATVDPDELDGWTVHELVAHLAANEALLAQLIGIPDPSSPERENNNERRTALAQDRHRQLEPTATIDEYAAFATAVDQHVSSVDPADLETDISWWGMDMRISSALIVRALETWTHADDIRRAIGLPTVAPAAPDLATMSARSLEWVPIMLASTGDDIAPGTATLRLTGPGGGTHTVQLGAEPAPPHTPPAFELTIDIVDYCRAVSKRVAPSGLPHAVTGDADLAERLVGALSSLAAV
jgi:uncharacterized protein (TIGR03083 family)